MLCSRLWLGASRLPIKVPADRAFEQSTAMAHIARSSSKRGVGS